MGGIIAVYYQAYLSAFSPTAYFNANTTAVVATTGQLSIPVTRALISGLHAIALGILLLLLSILLSNALYTQRHLGPRHHVYRLRWSTILTHVMASSPVLDEVIRGCERMAESDIKRSWHKNVRMWGVMALFLVGDHPLHVFFGLSPMA